jgi:uncharacterized damage-inducible protein DinB
MTAPAALEDLRYPVGKFKFPDAASEADRAAWLADIERTPAAMRAAVKGLTAAQVDTPYRPDGWTVRQVVHHVPDSHLNAYCRFKLALTEDTPTIKPYDESAWAKLPDTRDTPIEVSLTMLDVLHQRWMILLRRLTADDLKRTFRHPEHGRVLTLDQTLALYAWHGRHHVAHITSLRSREGWG